MIHTLRQYRHFSPAYLQTDIGVQLTQLVPEAHSLFCTQNQFKAHSDESDLFCHELAHCIVLLKQGKQHLLFEQNYGWEIISTHWTLAMARNEALVFAYQWQLEKLLKASTWCPLLTPEMIPAWLHMCCKQESTAYFSKLCNQHTQAAQADVEQMLRETIHLLVDYQQSTETI